MTPGEISLPSKTVPHQSPIVQFGLGPSAFFFVLGGLLSSYFLTRIFLEATASTSWPSVNGTLTQVQVTESVGRYKADVAYTFEVDGRQFVGTRIRASDGEYDFRDGAMQAIRGLQVGQRLPVFYDPSDPRRAVLRPEAGFVEYVLLLVPVALLAIGLRSFRLLWRSREATSEAGAAL